MLNQISKYDKTQLSLMFNLIRKAIPELTDQAKLCVVTPWGLPDEEELKFEKYVVEANGAVYCFTAKRVVLDGREILFLLARDIMDVPAGSEAINTCMTVKYTGNDGKGVPAEAAGDVR